MSAHERPTVQVELPADLIARMEEFKKDRDEDRDKPVQALVEELCRSYVRVREMSREDVRTREELERSYKDRPSDYDDAEEWDVVFREWVREHDLGGEGRP